MKHIYVIALKEGNGLIPQKGYYNEDTALSVFSRLKRMSNKPYTISAFTVSKKKDSICQIKLN